MKKIVKHWKLQDVTETIWDGVIKELQISTQLGSPTIYIKSFFVKGRSESWILVHRTTDRELPVITQPFLEGILKV